MEDCGMDMKVNGRKQALIELRRQLSKLIAEEQADDPAAAASAMHEAQEAVAGAAPEMGDEEEAEEVNPLEEDMKRMLNPKPRPRKPGTAVMIAKTSVASAPKGKGAMGKRKEYG